jgi:mannose-1-phosphate guanylyltransferase
MDSYGETWAVVLAAGSGTRLRDLTTASTGVVVPKQFCSLRGGPCLLQEALIRAAAIAPMRRICTVVAAQHRQWWTAPLKYLPKENTIVQPLNRGTAHGILLSLLHIAACDPHANVVLLPADHYLRDEATLARSLRRAADLAAVDKEAVYLLGVEPNSPDSELGYILPADASHDQPSRVARFVEKPDVDRARSLVEDGALWNVFILAAFVRSLLLMYEKSHAGTMAAMRCAGGVRASAKNPTALSDLYARLPVVDFSREILEQHEAMLKVVPVQNCGWTDLGTPRRVAETLSNLPQESGESTSHRRPTHYLNLAIQQSRLSRRHDPGLPA